MDSDSGGSRLEREYSGDTGSVIVIRRCYADQQTIVMFKANLPQAWTEDERISRLNDVLPMIDATALRHFKSGQFTNLRTISADLEDAALIVLGWGDLIEKEHD